MKYLIINADDYGYCPEQTKAITELYTKGLITSTSLMSVAHDKDNAIKTAKQNGITVGVHLTINSDDAKTPWKSITGAKSLENQKGLYESQINLTFKAKRKDIKKELEAQYKLLIDNGLEVDHADNHCGTLYGINGRRFYNDAYDFCAEHNLPYRFPEKPDFLVRQLGLSKLPKPLLIAFNHIVNQGKKKNVKMLTDLISNPWSMDKIKSYEAIEKYYLDCLDNLYDGVTEMFLHPSYSIGDNHEWKKREYEFKLLQSGNLLQKAHDKGIQVVSWGIFNENIDFAH